jgi:Uma2 family endonuclease
MAMRASRYYTAEMVRQLWDPTRHWPRYETVHGELLVTSAPRMWHQELVKRLLFALHTYFLGEREVGCAFTSPSDISWGLEDTLVQPDVFVISLEEARTLEWARVRGLLLAVEVLSPSSRRADLLVKRRVYQEQGTPLYWIVDGDARSVEVWTPDAHRSRCEREALVWQPAGAVQPFTLPLAELFGPM